MGKPAAPSGMWLWTSYRSPLPRPLPAGWKDPFLCDVGRGRTFQKVGEQDVPYFLLYNINDELQGIYLFSRSEIPIGAVGEEK